MAKTVMLRMDDEIYSIFAQAAKAENRSLSKLIETAALSRIRELQFVGDSEMSEILGNEKLLKRLRKGTRDAKARKGRLLE